MSSVRKTILLIMMFFLIPLLTGHAADTFSKSQVEHYGVIGFKKDFNGTLTVTPFSCDKTITAGAGHSRITYTGKNDVFTPDWVKQGVEFVAYRIHKNPVKISSEGFFPGIVGSRYSRVVRVIDGKNLIVNFEYNGGSREKARISTKVYGYFFIDCSDALRKMVADRSRPEKLIFQAGRTYVTKGMPNIPFHASQQSRNMHWVSSDASKKARIKISSEDTITRTSQNRIIPNCQIPDGAFFKLDTHDYSLYLNRIDIIGPTYSVPSVQERTRRVMYDYGRGECVRTLEIKNCDTTAEKKEYAANKIKLPKGASWLAPQITGIIGGGGRKGDRGDGVIDIIGYQRFNLIRSTWIALEIHSIKNNDGAGNWITIDGIDTDKDGMPVHQVYEADFMKRTRFPDIQISFHDLDVKGGRGRGVRIASDDFAWDMIANQYWTGGTSTSAQLDMVLEVDGFKLAFGNNGDWRRELNEPGGYYGYLNAIEILIFDRIPRKGDTVKLEKVSANVYRAWGWGLQVGDTFIYKGTTYTVASRSRKFKEGSILGSNPKSSGGAAHFWKIKLDGATPLNDAQPEVTINKSSTEYLLDGKVRKANMYFTRGTFGHWQYNRAEVNYEFRNILFCGNYRQTAGSAKGGKYEGLWELPVKQEWVNCWAMDTDGSTRGTPAKGIRSEAFNKTVLQLRNRHPKSKRRDHHILVDGGRLFAQRLNDDMSPVWIQNRPTLIYGSGSFGEPRLCNPVMMDTKGVVCPLHALSIALVGGYKLDLSNSVFGNTDANGPVDLDVFGNGTLILNNVEFKPAAFGPQKKVFYGGVRTRLANGLQKDKLNLHIQGKNGTGGFKLEGNPKDGSVDLKEWKLKKMLFCKDEFNVSAGWKAIPDYKNKFRINEKTPK